MILVQKLCDLNYSTPLVFKLLSLLAFCVMFDNALIQNNNSNLQNYKSCFKKSMLATI
jgi:hypothetical protein